MEVYKIRRKTDGKYSTGGSWPGFNKIGKIWKRKSDLSNHLNIVIEPGGKPERYDDCEIIICEVVERVIDAVPVSEYLRQREEAKQATAVKRKQLYEDFLKKKRYEQYEELKKEFEND